jgi:mannose-6-phosphate isomerase-like protein (cupin superfamily)
VAAVKDFPGSVGLTALTAYDWETADGEHGGSPHVHLACSEAYVVTGGAGRLETLTRHGLTTTTLETGDVVWFQPGTIHRVLNDGDLRVVVVMQNSGLPEAGDAVLTFPAEHLTTPDAYRAAASILDPAGQPSELGARRRRDLAVEGFTELKRRVSHGDPAALEEFYEAAIALAQPQVDRWRALVEAGPGRALDESRARLAALAAGQAPHLPDARVERIPRPDHPTYGMCGLLFAYDPIRRHSVDETC